MRRSRGPAGPVDRVTTRPRVGLLHYTCPPVIGGVETILYEQAVRLAARGYPVTILSGRGGPLPDQPAGKPAIIPHPHSRHSPVTPVPYAPNQGRAPAAFTSPQSKIEH